MNQIIPNLWVGNIYSALNKEGLDKEDIKYVVSAMRGKIKVDPVCSSHYYSTNKNQTPPPPPEIHQVPNSNR